MPCPPDHGEHLMRVGCMGWRECQPTVLASAQVVEERGNGRVYRHRYKAGKALVTHHCGCFKITDENKRQSSLLHKQMRREVEGKR